MNKSTGILLLLGFLLVCFFLLLVVVGIMVYAIGGASTNLLGGERIAVVRVLGPIITAEDWIDQIDRYSEDDSISAILVEIDSGGGGVVGSQNLYDAMVRARQEHDKTVVAYFNTMAASGAYYAACGSDGIISSPGALTGSIGVYMQLMKAKELLEKVGVDLETVKAGDYKNFGSFSRDLSPEEEKMLQATVDDIYMQFIEAVIEGRRDDFSQVIQDWNPDDYDEEYPFMPDVVSVIETYQEERERQKQIAARDMFEEAQSNVAAATAVDSVTPSTGEVEGATPTPEPTETPSDQAVFRQKEIYPPTDKVIENYTLGIAEGKVYTGRQAMQLGLVDRLGNFNDAVDYTAQLAGITGDPTLVEQRPQELTLLDMLSQQLSLFTGQSELRSPVRYEFPY